MARQVAKAMVVVARAVVAIKNPPIWPNRAVSRRTHWRQRAAPVQLRLHSAYLESVVFNADKHKLFMSKNLLKKLTVPFKF